MQLSIIESLQLVNDQKDKQIAALKEQANHDRAALEVHQKYQPVLSSQRSNKKEKSPRKGARETSTEQKQPIPKNKPTSKERATLLDKPSNDATIHRKASHIKSNSGPSSSPQRSIAAKTGGVNTTNKNTSTARVSDLLAQLEQLKKEKDVLQQKNEQLVSELDISKSKQIEQYETYIQDSKSKQEQIDDLRQREFDAQKAVMNYNVDKLKQKVNQKRRVNIKIINEGFGNDF